MRIEGATALITGGASGLGEAAARRLLDLGARRVAIIDMNAEKGRALEASLDRVLYVQADVSDEKAASDAVEDIAGRCGRLDILINAAAIGGPAKLLSKKGPMSMALFDRVLKVNLYGPIHIMRAAAPHMVSNEADGDGERGVIINVSSGAAWEGQVGQIAYSASKAALVGLTFPLMRELAAYGIRVVAVAPGAFDTPIYDGAPPELKQSLIAQALFPKRMGRAEEFAMFIEEIVRNPMHNGRAYRLDAGMILPAFP